MIIRCSKCGRFLGETHQPTIIMLKCPNCHSYHEYKLKPLTTHGILDFKPTMSIVNAGHAEKH